eukprot:TRINITY_DN4050_c0_g1_i1.p1 TRINITY_DN4050_c0_g1~~TRINITY_DN4050_c0_g1_i1.p1  ORF type:complete len:292 (+),score=87.20 TRINITY_DN4050_c0_g1_i1:191-1066(+)
MPQDPNIIATQTPSSEIHIFDSSKHTAAIETPEQFNPDLKLIGQKKEGFGLSWNRFRKGLLLGASHDGSIYSWDVESVPKTHESLEPVSRYEDRSGAVESAAWSELSEHLFASGGDDKRILLWDTRKEGKKATHQIEAHYGEVLSVDFSPFSEYLLASSSVDKTVAIWDLRNLHYKQCSLKQHQDEVSAVSWAPFNEAIIASASQDRRVFVWDLSRLGKDQTTEEAADGPPELLFIHGGHTSKVTDISWNPREELVMASVADDNILQVWQIAGEIYYEEGVEDQPGEKMKT